MGKIRVKTLGLEEEEKKQEKDAAKRREAKRAKKGEKAAKVKVPGGKGGERGVQVAPTDEDIKKMELAKEEIVEKKEKKKVEKKGKTRAKKKAVGKRHKMARKNIDKSKSYKLEKALQLLRKVKYAKFDEAIEIHVRVEKPGLKGEVKLPHGTGKTVRVVVADNAVVEQLAQGKTDFDVLLATPAFMPKLVKYAKLLGPKGLMPNPKNGTVTATPEEAIKKFAGGTIRYKTEAKAPLMHLSLGKMSHTDKQLLENFTSLVKAVGKKNILGVHLSSSMGPSAKIDLTSL